MLGLELACNASGNKTKDPDRRFYSFPADGKKKQNWLGAINRAARYPGNSINKEER